ALGGTGGSAVVEGLANEGSLEALEAAGDGASLASLGLLEKLRGLWYSIDQETGDCVWKAGLDSAAAVGFLQKVTAQSADAKARIAAARMLQEVGQPADGQVLVALAQEMKATGVVAPARPEGRRRGRDMGRDMGPPPGVMMGPGGPARPTGPYVPSGFEEPAGAPKPPEDFVLEGKSQFYALSLLVEAGDEAASARLREVVDGYEDAKLQVATMRALGAIGGEANLAFLRQKATGRKGNYENIQAFSAECRDRLAALSALGDAQDAAFLTQLLDLLDEGPPAVDAIPEVKDEYGKLSVWWPMKLQTGVCKCLAGLCRDRQLVELAADSTLQQQMVRRLISLIDRPVPQQELAGASADLTAAAVQALGRCASFYDETAGFVVKRLAVRLFPAPAAGPEARAGDGFDEPDPRAALRASRQRRRRTGRQGLTDPLKIALRDAVVHMAVRGDGLDVFDEVPGVLPEGDRADPGWNALVKELAEAPTSQYFGLLNRCFDAIDRPTKEAVCALTRGSAAAYGTEHAQFVAKMIKEPPEAIRERPAARAFGRPEGRPDIPDMSPEQLAMIQRERAEARMRGIERDMGGDVEFMPQAPIVRKEDDVAYEREGPRRTQEWSYSLTSQGERRELVRRQWSLVERLFEAGGAAVASAVQEEELVTCPTFGPAIGAMYVERDPEARADVVGQLERILTGATGAAAQPRAARTLAETRVRPRTEPRARQLAGEVSKRAAVAALRKIGGEEAARALFNGLVGPRIPAQRPQMGPMFGPPPGERMRPGGPYAGGAMGAAGMPVAVYIARALGSMGQLDLLRGALNAQGYQFFGQNPQAVREAVLVGIAYLPGDLNPIGILSELLGMASTERLRKAAAEAIETAFRRMAPD
ncbi:MAG: hypothetical protein KAX44_06630, partial [Candidatus Brocadiae bacterium]|nr:hypothetical protein [Candidatus Brocadiia bacterium]